MICHLWLFYWLCCISNWHKFSVGRNSSSQILSLSNSFWLVWKAYVHKMGKKKVKPNAFSEFMFDLIEKEKRAGRRHPKVSETLFLIKYASPAQFLFNLFTGTMVSGRQTILGSESKISISFHFNWYSQFLRRNKMLTSFSETVCWWTWKI